jgi:hypothetical protein
MKHADASDMEEGAEYIRRYDAAALDLVETTHTGPRHPWERSRATFFVNLVKRVLAGPPRRERPDVLDCGSGDAFFAAQLRDTVGGTVTCWDAFYDADTMTKLAGLYPSLGFTKSRPTRRFDVVLMLDVIEHVEDDVDFVRGIVQSCVHDDGFVIVSVPAWQRLFSHHDELLLHHRRYAPDECDRVLDRAGLRVVERGGMFHSLILPRVATVVKERVGKVVGRSPSGESAAATWGGGRLVTGLVDRALKMDNAVSRVASRAGVNMPGLSYWALARRSS